MCLAQWHLPVHGRNNQIPFPHAGCKAFTLTWTRTYRTHLQSCVMCVMCCACLYVQAKAAAAGAPLSLVPPLEEYEGSGVPRVQLGLAGAAPARQRGACSGACGRVGGQGGWGPKGQRYPGEDPAAGVAQESGRGLEGVDGAVRVTGGASTGGCGAAGRLAAIAARRLPEEYRRALASCQWPGRAQACSCSL